MEISAEELTPGVIKITLAGRMDLVGTNEIETKFAGIVAKPDTSFIVDLSSVSFLASLGIRTLLLNAKAVARKGYKFVMLNPASGVDTILKSAGIDALIPVYGDIDAALADMLAIDN